MTKRSLSAVIAAFLALAVTVPAYPQETKPDDTRSKELNLAPQLTKEQAGQLEGLRKQRGSCPGSFPVPIAASVFGAWYGTGGADILLSYPSTTTNEGGAWVGNAFFLAPCPGLYFFTVSFVKDSYYGGSTCGGAVGTTDDVIVYLVKNSTAIGGTGAWSGEGGGRRSTGAYSVVLRLNLGDTVQSWLHSDGGYHRCLGSYNFTGYRIGN